MALVSAKVFDFGALLTMTAKETMRPGEFA